MQGNKPAIPGWLLALIVAIVTGALSAGAVWALSKKLTGGD